MYNLTGLAYYVWFLIVKSLLIAKKSFPGGKFRVLGRTFVLMCAFLGAQLKA